MSKIVLIYPNAIGGRMKFHLNEAFFSPNLKTVSVGVWQRRSVKGFAWGEASEALAAEVDALNAAADDLEKMQRDFIRRLEATQSPLLAKLKAAGVPRSKKPASARPPAGKLIV